MRTWHPGGHGRRIVPAVARRSSGHRASHTRPRRGLELAAAGDRRAVVALGIVASRLRLVLLPVGVALLLSTALVPPARWLIRRGLRPLLATWITMLGFLGAVVGIGLAIVPPLVDEFGDLGPTLEDAADEVEGWLIDGPLGVDQATIEDARDRVQGVATDAFSSDGALVDSAVIAGEVVAGVIAVLVSLVSSGPEAALVVAVVAVLVQQFDNDLLAPVIYGRALKIHPLVVILAVTTGAAIGGFLGAFLAVPLAAVLVNATTAYRDDPAEVNEPAEPSDATGSSGAAGPA